MSGSITIYRNSVKLYLYVHKNGFELFDNILRNLTEILANVSHVELLERFDRMRIISIDVEDDIYDEGNVPGDKDINKYIKFAAAKFNRDRPNWYSLLSKCQGDLTQILKSGVIINTTNLDEQAYNITLDLDKMIISPTFDSIDYPYTIKIKDCIVYSRDDDSDDNDNSDSDADENKLDDKSVLLIDGKGRKKVIKFL
jgi:hypothetical protein